MERGVSLKKILAVLLLVFTLGLTGCVQMVEITDEESETIARTAAWLLFKYDKNYTENLITPTPTPIPSPTATPTPAPEEETKLPEQMENDQPVSSDPVLPENNVEPDELIGSEGIRLIYDGYELYDSYTFDSFSVEPKSAENCLMIVFLKLKNTGTETAAVNVLELQPKCQLYVNKTKVLSPKRTVLLNDFQYLSLEIPTGEEYNSALVFEVEKAFAPTALDLYMMVEDNVAHINLQ